MFSPFPLFIYFYLFIHLLRKTSLCRPGWPGIGCATQVGLKLGMVFLPLPPLHWGSRYSFHFSYSLRWGAGLSCRGLVCISVNNGLCLLAFVHCTVRLCVKQNISYIRKFKWLFHFDLGKETRCYEKFWQRGVSGNYWVLSC